MPSIFKTVLSEIGWDSRYAVPDIIDENKILFAELHKKELELVEVETKLDRNKDEKQYMTEMLKHLKQELENTEALCQAMASEEESERHLTALAAREEGRLTQEIAKMEKDHKYLKGRWSSHENEIMKAKIKLEEFRNQMNWEQQTMDAFLQKAEREYEDTMAMAKYAQQDERRIKLLTRAIEKKTAEAHEKRRALDKELIETQSTQIALDKTTENLQQALLETQLLIRQWENTISLMKQRDYDIQQCTLQLAESNQTIRERTSATDEMKHLLDSQKNNNKETNRKLIISRQQGMRFWRELKQQENSCNSLKNELESYKALRDRATADLDNATSRLSKMKRDIEDNNKKLTESRAHNKALEQKLEAVTQSTLSEEERAAQMEQMLKEEELAIKNLEIQLQQCREDLISNKDELLSVKNKYKDTIGQISRNKCTLKNLENQRQKLENELINQQNTMNEQDNQIATLSKKLSLMQGNDQSQNKVIIDQKIADLTSVLEQKKKASNKLTKTLKEFEDCIRHLKKKMEKSVAQKTDLSNKVEDLVLVCNANEKELKKLRASKQDNMVEHNIIKMEVKRMRDLLYNKANSVLSLEKRKLELQSAKKEREDEVKACKDELRKQYMISENERLNLSVEVNGKLSGIDIMKKRFEVRMLSMAAPEGEEAQSQAYFITKTAQQKEELKQKGSDLDKQIKRVEGENRALENTILMFNHTTSSFRKTLRKVQESSPEYKQKVKLEGQLRTVEETLKSKKKLIQELQQDIQDMRSTLECLLQETHLQREHMKGKQIVVEKLRDELNGQQQKIDRAMLQCSRWIEEVRSSKGSSTETFEELDIKLVELKEFNKSINRMLLEAMKDSPELRSVSERLFQQANLSLPSAATTSSRSTKSSSSRSSGSLRSFGSSASSTPRPPLSHTPVTTVKLGLDLTVTPPPVVPSHRSSSSSSSSNSRRMRKL